MSLKDFGETLNRLGANRIPFLFLVDFEMENPIVMPLDTVRPEEILYDINGRTNFSEPYPEKHRIDFIKHPIPFEAYKEMIERVQARLRYGDSYLANLTIRTRVASAFSLKQIFLQCRAKYKLLFGDRFLVFSPETFVRMASGKIFAYPMKGTIDASVAGASEKIINDPKEKAEHVTIVDLLRNDISLVADNVRVTRFRYLDTIRTTHKTLLQVSSEICGDLPHGYGGQLGDILLRLLPAGSVSGAPKRMTLDIIREAEGRPRGYYTGVVGIFDGDVLDSGVMIRFIENDGGQLYYRSGGGITAQSDDRLEYEEAIDKVYVPVD